MALPKVGLALPPASNLVSVGQPATGMCCGDACRACPNLHFLYQPRSLYHAATTLLAIAPMHALPFYSHQYKSCMPRSRYNKLASPGSRKLQVNILLVFSLLGYSWKSNHYENSCSQVLLQTFTEIPLQLKKPTEAMIPHCRQYSVNASLLFVHLLLNSLVAVFLETSCYLAA